MAAPRVRVALPWLQGALAEASANDALPAMHALRWLGGRGRLQSGEPGSWREWLLEPVCGADMLARWPAGAAIAGQNGLAAAGPGCWCIAQPVHLTAGLDHLRLAPLTEAALAPDEADELGARVSSHFGIDELTVMAFIQGAWLLRLPRSIDCSTQPPDAVVGHDVHDFLPSGSDGARIRSLMNEIQMLLHEHPVNRERVARRLPAVNSLWLWGFGRLGEASTARLPTLCTDDAWLAGIWRLHGAAGRPLEEYTVAEPLADDDALLAWSRSPAGSPGEILAEAERRCFAPALDALRSGTVGGVDILLGARAFTVDSGARFRFWRRPKPLAEVLA